MSGLSDSCRYAMLAGLIAVCTLAAGSAHGVQVTWNLSGTVGAVNGDAAELGSLGVVVGTPFTASFSFDAATPASNPSDPPFAGCCDIYLGAVLEATFDAGTYSVAYAPIESLILAPVGINHFEINTAASATPTLLDPSLSLYLIDSVAGGLSLPIAPPLLGHGTQIQLSLSSSDWAVHSFDFTIDYAVPEANTSAPLALFTAVLAARTVGRRLRASRP